MPQAIRPIKFFEGISVDSKAKECLMPQAIRAVTFLNNDANFTK